MQRKTFLRSIAVLPLFSIISKALGKAKGVFISESCKTQADAEGPYYKADAPSRSVIETEGTPLRIEGKIFQAKDCETPVANAVVDIWHCNNHGEYDLQGFKGRGQVRTDANGNYSFTTILPPPYGRRPKHIHVKVRAAGHKELTTQIYFDGDPNIKNDFARNAEKERIISLNSSKEIKTGTFNIYL